MAVLAIRRPAEPHPRTAGRSPRHTHTKVRMDREDPPAAARQATVQPGGYRLERNEAAAHASR